MYADFWYLFQVDKSVIKDLQILKKKVTEHACVFDTYVTVKLDCGNWACDVYIHAVALKKKKVPFKIQCWRNGKSPPS